MDVYEVFQQEREGREKLTKIVARLKSDFAEYHFPDGDPRNLMALEAYIGELDAALAQTEATP